MSLTSKLSALCDKKEMSLVDLSKKARLDMKQVDAVFGDERVPTKREFNSILRALDVNKDARKKLSALRCAMLYPKGETNYIRVDIQRKNGGTFQTFYVDFNELINLENSLRKCADVTSVSTDRVQFWLFRAPLKDYASEYSVW